MARTRGDHPCLSIQQRQGLRDNLLGTSHRNVIPLSLVATQLWFRMNFKSLEHRLLEWQTLKGLKNSSSPAQTSHFICKKTAGWGRPILPKFRSEPQTCPLRPSPLLLPLLPLEDEEACCLRSNDNFWATKRKSRSNLATIASSLI